MFLSSTKKKIEYHFYFKRFKYTYYFIINRKKKMREVIGEVVFPQVFKKISKHPANSVSRKRSERKQFPNPVEKKGDNFHNDQEWISLQYSIIYGN